LSKWWRVILGRFGERSQRELASGIQSVVRDPNAGRDALERLRSELFIDRRAASPEDGEQRVGYIASSRMPTRAANNVHVLKMCDAIVQHGYRLTLVFEQENTGHSLDVARWFDEFGVRSKFETIPLQNRRTRNLRYLDKALAAIDANCTAILTRCPYSAFFSALAGLPTVLELHRPVDTRSLGYVWNLAKLPSFRGLIAITGALAKRIAHDVPHVEKRLTVIPDAADPVRRDCPEFPIRRQPGSLLEIGYAGHLYAGKGMELIAELAKRLPAVGFHVMGGLDSDIESWRRRTDALGNVFYYGHHPHADVEAFLQSVDVVVAPYQRSTMVFGGGHDIAPWMSPLKIFEYMASGKPILASDLPVLHEVLADERTALLCNPDDAAPWVRSIERLIAEPGLRSALGLAAKQTFEQRHTWQIRSKMALDVLLGN
jgi:glycosyltransferase involved in cell wall biosynthesis